MFDIEQKIKDEWRSLGFYYDNGNDNKEWRFFGNKKGLQNFVFLLNDYVKNSKYTELSQETSFGPYSYLKIVTWNKQTITPDYFAGTIEDLTKLKNILADKILSTDIGQTFTIDKEYGIDNQATTIFYVMDDNFDPVSMDKNYS